MAAANNVSLALREDGTVTAYGTDEDMIEAVSAWRDIQAISADGALVVGLKKDGTVVTYFGSFSNFGNPTAVED